MGRGAAAGGRANPLLVVQGDGEATPGVQSTVLRDHLQGARLLLAALSHPKIAARVINSSVAEPEPVEPKLSFLTPLRHILDQCFWIWNRIQGSSGSRFGIRMQGLKKISKILNNHRIIFLFSFYTTLYR